MKTSIGLVRSGRGRILVLLVTALLGCGMAVVPATPAAAVSDCSLDPYGCQTPKCGSGGKALPATVLGSARSGDVRERDIRFALEDAYREMALAAHGPEKIRLVDLANASRPRTRT